MTQLELDLDDAVCRGELNEVIGLLKQGADIENKDCFGYTPIIAASRVGSLEIVKLLYENGANIYSRDNENKTAYDIALEAAIEVQPNDWGHANIAEYLKHKIKT